MTAKSSETDEAIRAERRDFSERNKTDQRNSRWTAFALALAFGAAAVALAWFAYFMDEHQPRHANTIGIMFLAIFSLLVAVISPFVAIALRRARSHHGEMSRAEFESIDNAAKSINDEALGKLVSFNFRLMDRFVTVALGQAKASYIFCAISASATLLVLLAGTTTLIAASTMSAQITVGVLSVAGAALSGYLSVTFMQTYKLASEHMGYYYGQPLVHCYLLHAEWLAKRAGHGDHELYVELQRQLLKATLGASRNAQEQLSELLGLEQISVRPVPKRTDRDSDDELRNGYDPSLAHNS